MLAVSSSGQVTSSRNSHSPSCTRATPRRPSSAAIVVAMTRSVRWSISDSRQSRTTRRRPSASSLAVEPDAAVGIGRLLALHDEVGGRIEAFPETAGDPVEVGHDAPQVGAEIVGQAALAHAFLDVVQRTVALGARALVGHPAERGGAVEDLRRALELIARRERVLDRVAAGLRVVAELVGRLPVLVGEQDAAGGDAEVIHEEAADQIVLVADAAGDLAVAVQQEARVLDAAESKDEQPGPHPCARAGQVPDHEGLGAAVGPELDVDQIGVQPDLEPARRLELGAVLLAEPGRRRAEAEDPRRELVGRQRQQASGGLEHRGIVAARAEVEDLVGGGVERFEVGAPDRPAAVGDPGPGQEVALVERSGHAAPMVGRAAELAHPGGVEVPVGLADAAPAVEVLALLLELEAAALQDHDPRGAACRTPAPEQSRPRRRRRCRGRRRPRPRRQRNESLESRQPPCGKEWISQSSPLHSGGPAGPPLQRSSVLRMVCQSADKLQFRLTLHTIGLVENQGLNASEGLGYPRLCASGRHRGREHASGA